MTQIFSSSHSRVPSCLLLQAMESAGVLRMVFSSSFCKQKSQGVMTEDSVICNSHVLPSSGILGLMVGDWGYHLVRLAIMVSVDFSVVKNFRKKMQFRSQPHPTKHEEVFCCWDGGFPTTMDDDLTSGFSLFLSGSRQQLFCIHLVLFVVFQSVPLSSCFVLTSFCVF